MNEDIISSAPIEILLKLFSYLSPEEVIRLSSLNRSLSQAAYENSLWKDLYNKHFNHRKPSNQENKNEYDWYQEFKNAYIEEYKDVPEGKKAYFSLVKEGNIESLMNDKFDLADLDLVDIHGLSIVDWAIQMDLQKLLDHYYQQIIKSQDKMNANDQTPDKRTILFWAIRLNQSIECITELLSANNEIEYLKDKQLLITAAKQGQCDIIKLIHEKANDLIDEVDEYNQTPLLWAAAKGHEDIVRYLISKGASLNVATSRTDSHFNGYTPLDWAIEGNHGEIVSLLMKNQTWTQHPVHIAAQRDKLVIVKMLIEKNPHLITLPDTENKTPLYWASKYGHKDFVQYLLKKTVLKEPAELQAHKNQALEGAIAGGSLEVVKLLITQGAAEGLTKHPIFMAIESRDLDIVKYFTSPEFQLLEMPPIKELFYSAVTNIDPLILDHFFRLADPEKSATLDTLFKEFDLFSALQHAATNGYIDVIDVAIRRYPELLNSTNGLNQTLLHFATNSGQEQMVRFLLEKSARTDIAINFPSSPHHGKTPIDLAKEKYPESIYKILVGANTASSRSPLIAQEDPIILLGGNPPQNSINTEDITKKLSAKFDSYKSERKITYSADKNSILQTLKNNLQNCETNQQLNDLIKQFNNEGLYNQLNNHRFSFWSHDKTRSAIVAEAMIEACKDTLQV
ncbi:MULTISPECIES: ankyrin repeat domain-containing protein [unclassified Legionella]|uniref:ankyrin repeat domain-containing protein n=1 Tax=unclassified Legionella TaxID=2622702 RepID=UPI0013EF8F49|nr:MULTISPECIES: ankyrin repeat domain-containing protein [unclassified Legionella]MDI9819243.1 ankyrin repeat domain-containing protein [Legionella sp. PL877]